METYKFGALLLTAVKMCLSLLIKQNTASLGYNSLLSFIFSPCNHIHIGHITLNVHMDCTYIGLMS